MEDHTPAQANTVNHADNDVDPPVEKKNPNAMQDGGAFAWLQCAAAFFLFFNSWGLVNMFGKLLAIFLPNSGILRLRQLQAPTRLSMNGFS